VKPDERYERMAREIVSTLAAYVINGAEPHHDVALVALVLERAAVERAIEEMETPRPYRYSFDSQLAALRKRLEELGK